MVYAVINSEGKIEHIFSKLNHFTSSGWADTRDGDDGWRIAAIEPTIIAAFPITEEGIAEIRSFNSSLPKKNGKKGKVTYRSKPDDILPGVI